MVENLKILGLFSGKAVPFGPYGEPSAIVKEPFFTSARLSRTGIVGDECGDPRHHGGVEKALHQYAFDHYAFWQAEIPEAASSFRQGSFGENVSAADMTEEDVCIGDIFRFGTALIEVSQARQPCWKLNVRFNRSDMAQQVQDSRKTGWYYRVLEEGDISPEACFRLMERPNPDWTLARLLRCFYETPLDRGALKEASALKALSPSWKNVLQKRLETGCVEDWSRRLQGQVALV